MNKIMFIICAIFALIVSCKNDATSKDLESSEQNVKKTEQEIKKQFNEVLDILETKDLNTLDTAAIEKAIKELKDKIDKSDSKKTSLETYSEYEEQIKQIREKLNGKGNFEDSLKGLEESLKKKKEERKQALEDAKKKFEEYKKQVDTSTGQTRGDQVQRQGGVGVQAWQCAKNLGLGVSYSSDTGTDSNELAKKVIDDSIKKIDEELKNTIENNGEDKKE
ncbi:ErpL protein [Borreliella burgdorferi]|uniref:ErpL protein n=1 Tax=Borreliella burgdorferi TaxID=139 RepID=UPI001E3CA913|nr:ErpL protein [Borreliella burgdorferi]MCD2374551.1 ErpL protein [Borreliella burgdorferi]MCD2385147.1 ErpL protein [Borreliella burgdorferi]MCD2393726.1 ErpL protein [Borreliella burgdorferi]MCD2410207.1 ErpL protein [Borreliella burgdorferi]MCD2416077.1 ErpL protein [Borreliella burgdorferi]